MVKICEPVWNELQKLKKAGVDTTRLEDVFCDFECSTEHIVEHGGKAVSDSDIKYADFMLDKQVDERWHTFAGRVFLIGVKLGWTSEKIREYVFETYHGMDLETETPKTVPDIEKDMVLYADS